MSGWGLPTQVEVGGAVYGVATDYRDILQIIGILTDEEADGWERVYLALGLFYDDFDRLPQADYREAYGQLCRFLACGQEEDGGKPSVKLIDWEQDERMIAAEVNKVAGCEVRALPYLHWWTFIGYYSGIGEGPLAAVVGIRSKLKRGKKLEKWEREYYNEHRREIDLRRKYTPEEREERDRLLRLLDGRGNG